MSCKLKNDYISLSHRKQLTKETKVKVIATTARGIEKVQEFDGAHVVPFDTFYPCLSNLTNGCELGCDLNDEQIELIKSEYGIN